MKDLQLILSALESHETAILATVVDIEGSGYRRPGARMLISPDGFGIGTVSGGCLEADVLERAQKVLATGVPTVIKYDTTKDESSVFGLGMGCRGIVRILLEPVSKDAPIVGVFRRVVGDREQIAVATAIAGGEIVGERVFEGAIIDEFRASGAATAVRREGEFEFFLESIAPPLKVFVFGAGHDALPLVGFMKELGWVAVVVDHRPAFATRERFPAADEVIHADPREFVAEPLRGPNLAAVVMTHNFDRDRALIPLLLESELLYLGALGPKTRTERIIGESGPFGPEQLAKLYAPVGLDIGGDTPEAIALAIVGEIQAVIKNRSGGHLRQRSGPIYDRA